MFHSSMLIGPRRLTGFGLATLSPRNSRRKPRAAAEPAASESSKSRGEPDETVSGDPTVPPTR